jgi:hypothetical protein
MKPGFFNGAAVHVFWVGNGFVWQLNPSRTLEQGMSLLAWIKSKIWIEPIQDIGARNEPFSRDKIKDLYIILFEQLNKPGTF